MGRCSRGAGETSLQSWCWRNQFAVADRDLVVGSGDTRRSTRAAFVERSLSGYRRMLSKASTPMHATTMPVFRTNGEREYLDNLNLISEEQLTAWRGQTITTMTAWCPVRPQLVAEFRYLRKDSPYWEVSVRDERRFRNRFGLAVPYQCLSLFGVRRRHLVRGFVALTEIWQRIEVPRGCTPELPIIFSYKM